METERLIVILCVLFFITLVVLAVLLGEDMKNCKRSHSETTTTYLMVGKTMMPVTSVHQVCDEWYPEAQ